jgi:hypothetical protein
MDADYAPFKCKFKLTDNHRHYTDYEGLNKLFHIRLIFKSDKWLCELQFDNKKLGEYFDMIKYADKAPSKIDLWMEDGDRKSDKYQIGMYPPFYLNQANPNAIDFEIRGDVNSHDMTVNIVDYMANCLEISSNSNLISITKQGFHNFQSKYLLTLYLNNLQTTELFVELKCALNGQHMRIPLKLQFKTMHGFQKQQATRIDENESIVFNLLAYIQSNTNQIITFLALLSLILISVLFMMKTKLQAHHDANAKPIQKQPLNRSFDRFQTTFYKNLNSSNHDSIRHRFGSDTHGYSWSTPNQARNESSSTTSLSPFSSGRPNQNQSIDKIKLFSIDPNTSSAQ